MAPRAADGIDLKDDKFTVELGRPVPAGVVKPAGMIFMGIPVPLGAGSAAGAAPKAAGGVGFALPLAFELVFCSGIAV